MGRYDLPKGTVLLGSKASQVYTDPDAKLSFFYLQKDFRDDQFMCVIENNTTGKALAFIMMHNEIASFIDSIKSESQRDRRIEIMTNFAQDHAPIRSVEISEGRYKLGDWT